MLVSEEEAIKMTENKDAVRLWLETFALTKKESCSCVSLTDKLMAADTRGT